MYADWWSKVKEYVWNEMFANYSTLLTERGLIKEAWPNSEMIRILPET